MPDVLDRARQIGWYHTLELAPGFETPGMFDLRDRVAHYHLPADLTGKRALDVGTWDGFWAFELERRGAEVVAIDLDDEQQLDWPPRRRPTAKEVPDHPRGAGFAIAKEALGSSVTREVCSVYDATPERLGTFDLVFAGSILIHLRDQLRALEALASVTKPGGTLISAEEYDRRLSALPGHTSRFLADREKSVVFWLPALRTWKKLLVVAGYDEVEVKERFTLPSRHGWSVRHATLHARKRA